MATGKQQGLQAMARMLSAVVVMLLLGLAAGELVDIKPYYSLILERHNELRRGVSPGASDMREMMWDDGLAREAEEWSKYCRYERPPKYMYDCGSNLFYQRKYVHSWHSIRSNVRKGLQSWSREQQYFRYGKDCGIACAYVQMIYSSTYRVGCAMNKCSSLKVGSGLEKHSTLFLCFYAPRGKLLGTYPYRTGGACAECPAGTRCSDSLCVEGTGVVSRPEPVRKPETGIELAPSPTVPRQPILSADALTDTEAHFLMQIQNMYREQEGCPKVQWDAKLKQWTDWIVNCQVDYPGPPHSYTNFYRCADHMPVYEVVYGWKKEGRNTNLQMDKGCRTPYDREQCNHYTNMMQPRITSMACSACNCGDGTRQLVCIYDNHVERGFRGYKK